MPVILSDFYNMNVSLNDRSEVRKSNLLINFLLKFFYLFLFLTVGVRCGPR